MIALVPARKDSKRLPGKNTMSLAGYYLCEWATIHGERLGLDVYVSTDCQRTALTCSGLGATTIWRPSNLCTDHTSSQEVVEHALAVTGADSLVLLQPTNPLRSLSVAREAMKIADRECCNVAEATGRNTLDGYARVDTGNVYVVQRGTRIHDCEHTVAPPPLESWRLTDINTRHDLAVARYFADKLGITPHKDEP